MSTVQSKVRVVEYESDRYSAPQIETMKLMECAEEDSVSRI